MSRLYQRPETRVSLEIRTPILYNIHTEKSYLQEWHDLYEFKSLYSHPKLSGNLKLFRDTCILPFLLFGTLRKKEIHFVFTIGRNFF